MTLEECAIVTLHTGICMLEGKNFEYLYKYAEKLMGHPVYTHELAVLADELKERSRADFLNLCRSAANTCENPREIARTANDCISRQAAINAVAQYMYFQIPDGDNAFAYGFKMRDGKYVRLKVETSDECPEWAKDDLERREE